MSLVLPAIPALGTTWLVELFDEVSTETADETSSLIRSFLSEFELKYSRFNRDSVISTINRAKTLKHPDDITATLLTLGQQFYKDTSGIFNCLIGEHLAARGYDTDYSFIPKVEPTNFPNPLTDLHVTEKEIVLTNGLIDLGGYGKGYLIDHLAELLKSRGFAYFLINGGGDMYATSDHDTPIPIYLEHPSAPGTYIAKTMLHNHGFAASSTHKRRWKVSGKEYSHLIDTRTHKTEHNSDTLGIYVKAPNALLADVWSTTLLLTDPANFRDHLHKNSIDFASFNIEKQTLMSSASFDTLA